MKRGKLILKKGYCVILTSNNYHYHLLPVLLAKAQSIKAHNAFNFNTNASVCLVISKDFVQKKLKTNFINLFRYKYNKSTFVKIAQRCACQNA